jgi:hypothetical protein
MFKINFIGIAGDLTEYDYCNLNIRKGVKTWEYVSLSKKNNNAEIKFLTQDNAVNYKILSDMWTTKHINVQEHRGRWKDLF